MFSSLHRRQVLDLVSKDQEDDQYLATAQAGRERRAR
jgi:hypothetical protein